MPNITKLSIGGTSYDIKDDSARQVLNSKGYAHFIDGYYRTPAVGESVYLQTSENFRTTKIPVTPGEKITIHAAGNTGYSRLYVFINSSGNALNRCAANISGTYELVAPAGAAYLAVNDNIPTMPEGYYVKKGINDNDPNLLVYKELDFIQGGLTDSGAVGSSLVYCVTDFIPIKNIFSIIKPVGCGLMIARYDSSKEFISRISVNESSVSEYNRYSVEKELAVTNTQYFRIAAKWVSDGTDVRTTPSGMAKSALEIRLVGASDLVYEKSIRHDETESFRYSNWEQGTINATGGDAGSVFYCRTNFIKSDSITRLYKPSNFRMLMTQFDAEKGFVVRNQIGNDANASDYDCKSFANLIRSNTKYVRISVSKIANSETGPTAPDDVIFSDVTILFVGGDEDSNQIPNYYYSTGYLPGKIESINQMEDSLSAESDSFIFITDYHIQQNARKSPLLIEKIMKDTGIKKLVFGGDAGGSSDLSYMYRSARENAGIYEQFGKLTPNFYGIVGNHEWNDTQNTTHEASPQEEVYSRAGIVNFYLSRFDTISGGMSTEGNYYVDNVRAKIRYFFMQDTGQAKISNESIIWLGNQLKNVPENYYVVVFSHYAYTGGVLNTTSMTGRGNMSVIRIAQLLGALKTRSSVTVNLYANTGETTGTETFNYSGSTVTPVCIISGHTHWDAALTTSQSDYGILTIATTTDAYGYNQDPSTHESAPRLAGTIEEQAFDVVSIDLAAGSRKVHLTRIGGGSNREFTF